MRGDTDAPAGKLRMVNCASPQYWRALGIQKTLTTCYLTCGGALFINAGSLFTGLPLKLPTRYAVGKTGGILAVNRVRRHGIRHHLGLGIIQTPRIAGARGVTRGTLVEILPQYRAAPLPVTFRIPSP